MPERFENGVKMIDYLRSKDAQGDTIGFNEDLASKILAKGDAAELADLRLFWRENGRTVSEERMGVFSYYEKLRQQVHRDRQAALAKRKAEIAEKTEEEQALDCYLEEIEPQVRQAVLNLNRKGFKTQGSGFASENTQKIYCKDDQFNKLNFPDGLLAELKKRGVVLKVDPRSITISLDRKLNLAEIEAIWLEIEKWVKSKDKSLT
ncbi:MAG: hypothetical protein Q7K35_00335 [bacterium]|nr:hypothetical protein [bacterium]